MKSTVLLASFSLPLFAIGCSVPKHRPTLGSYRQAIVRGELKEALVSYEAQAREAEKNAQGSLFPQQYWRQAAEAYGVAGNAATEPDSCKKQSDMAKRLRNSGEVERSI